jgi:hypothetical protein
MGSRPPTPRKIAEVAMQAMGPPPLKIHASQKAVYKPKEKRQRARNAVQELWISSPKACSEKYRKAAEKNP